MRSRELRVPRENSIRAYRRVDLRRPQDASSKSRRDISLAEPRFSTYAAETVAEGPASGQALAYKFEVHKPSISLKEVVHRTSRYIAFRSPSGAEMLSRASRSLAWNLHRAARRPSSVEGKNLTIREVAFRSSQEENRLS